jgi:uncharacterized UBP type Zn finger protein
MCEHLGELEGRSAPVQASARGCEECLRGGSAWVHLRLCLTCGHVGCCDSSPNRHATRHYHATKHPVVKSFEPGETWAWCYADEDLVRSFDAFPDESPPTHYGPADARG